MSTPLSDAHAAQLEQLLRDLEAHYRASLALTAEHRAAISAANPAAIGACVARQQQAARALLDLEARRARLVGLLAPGPRAAGGPPVTLTALATRAAPAPRARLLALAEALRALMRQADAQERAVRAASESLLAHMHGMISQVRRALSPAGAYHRPGSHAEAAVVLSGLDITS